MKDKIFYYFTRPMFFYAKLKTQFFNKLFFGKIGRDSIILRDDLILNPSHIFIGKNSIVHSGARILCFTRHRGGQKFNPRLEIGDDVKIQQGIHIVCTNSIKIGSGVSIAAHTSILDSDHEYKDINRPIHDQELSVGSVEIGDNSLVGAGVMILKAKIGRNCIVGANSVVKGEFPDYSVIAGIPARVIKTIK